MARTLVGLDVGTTAVRAAEVRLGRGKPSLVRFGQVALPPGAVIAGEVVDVPTVAAALRRLWKDGGFTGKRVITGLAGQRVVARTTELPTMTDDEIRSSLPFHVQELIPIPLAEAVLDHQVLEPIVDADGTERLRVLVVAAHRDVLRSLIAALDGAGLEAERVDLIPYALIRALDDGGFAELEHPNGAAAEAIIDVGGGVTNVIVHEHGVPRFIRTLATGGVELTEAIVTGLDVPFEEAEALKRGGGVDVETRYARDVMQAAIAPVIDEIRTSLDFWQAQSPEADLRRIIVVGRGASVDVTSRLEQALSTTVEQARAFAGVDTSKAGLDEVSRLAAASVATVAFGLALSGESLRPGQRQINLLPVEIAEHRRERRNVLLVAAGVMAFAVALLGVYGLRDGQVSDARLEASEAEARSDQLTAEIANLQDVEALQADIASRRQTVMSTLGGDVAWTSLITDVSAALPEDVWLTSFSGTRGDATTPGHITVGGMGSDQTSTARWIQRVSELDALSDVWVPSSTKTPAGTSPEVVQFSSNATLTPAAVSSRASSYAEGAR